MSSRRAEATSARRYRCFGASGVALCLVAACDCGTSTPAHDGDDARTDDSPDLDGDQPDTPDPTDIADDTDAEAEAESTDGGDADADREDVGERYVAPWDGDLDYSDLTVPHDCTPPEPLPGCETPGAETPIWERSSGDEWCIDPVYRDLTSSWREVAPGCEQVTYLDFVGGPTGEWTYDVWDGLLVVLGRGVFVVDAACRSELQVQAEDHAVDGSYVTDGWPTITSWGAAHHRHWRTDADGYSAVVVSYERLTRLKRMIQVQHNPDRADSRGTWYPLDAWGRTLLAARQRIPEPRCYHDGVSLDMQTGVQLDLTTADLPSGRCIWDGSLWEDTGILSGGSWNLHLVDVRSPGVEVFAETAPCQWNAVSQGTSVCWEQTVDPSCPLSGGFGGTIWCADPLGPAPWNASPDVHCADGRLCWACNPAVFGPWIAWVLSAGASCDGAEVALLNRRTREEYRLFDRTPGFRPTRAYRLRLWADNLYFQAEPPSGGSLGNVFRCDLRTLFPEAYE